MRQYNWRFCKEKNKTKWSVYFYLLDLNMWISFATGLSRIFLSLCRRSTFCRFLKSNLPPPSRLGFLNSLFCRFNFLGQVITFHFSFLRKSPQLLKPTRREFPSFLRSILDTFKHKSRWIFVQLLCHQYPPVSLEHKAKKINKNTTHV